MTEYKTVYEELKSFEEGDIKKLEEFVTKLDVKGQDESKLTILYGGEIENTFRTSDAINSLKNSDVRIIDKTQAAKILSSPNFAAACERVYGEDKGAHRQRDYPDQSKSNAFINGREYIDANGNKQRDNNSAWDIISEKFVRETKGEVITITPEATNERVFGQTELHASLDTPEITKINGVDREQLKQLADEKGLDTCRHLFVSQTYTGLAVSGVLTADQDEAEQAQAAYIEFQRDASKVIDVSAQHHENRDRFVDQLNDQEAEKYGHAMAITRDIAQDIDVRIASVQEYSEITLSQRVYEHGQEQDESEIEQSSQEPTPADPSLDADARPHDLKPAQQEFDSAMSAEKERLGKDFEVDKARQDVMNELAKFHDGQELENVLENSGVRSVSERKQIVESAKSYAKYARDEAEKEYEDYIKGAPHQEAQVETSEKGRFAKAMSQPEKEQGFKERLSDNNDASRQSFKEQLSKSQDNEQGKDQSSDEKKGRFTESLSQHKDQSDSFAKRFAQESRHNDTEHER